MGLSNKSRLIANKGGPVISSGCTSPVSLPSCLTDKIFSGCNLQHQIKDVYPVCSRNIFFLRRIYELSIDHVIAHTGILLVLQLMAQDGIAQKICNGRGITPGQPSLPADKILASVACACCFSWFCFHLRQFSTCFLISLKTNPNS